MTVLLHAEPRVSPCRVQQAICRLVLRMHTRRCSFFPACPRSTPTALPSSAFRTAEKWRISRLSRRCGRRSIPDRSDLPRTWRSTPAGILAVAEPGAYTGAPVLMLLAAKDDNLPVTKIESYLAYARAAGAPAPIETVIYPDAYHAWTVSDLGGARFYPDYVSTKKCPLILLGAKRPAVLIDGELKPFDPATFGKCVAAAPGYSMGFDAAVRAQSINDAVRFLQRTLRL